MSAEPAGQSGGPDARQQCYQEVVFPLTNSGANPCLQPGQAASHGEPARHLGHSAVCHYSQSHLQDITR